MSWTSVVFFVILLTALAPGEGDALPIQNYSFFMYPNATPEEGSPLMLVCCLDPPLPLPSVRPISYAWNKNGKVIPGQTGPTLTFTNLTKMDEGDYQCGDPVLNFTRWTFQLSVSKQIVVSVHRTSVSEAEKLPPPSIFHYRQPLLARGFALNCIFQDGYTPNENTRYIWYKNSIMVKGESGPLLRFPNLTEADEGEYKCTAWDRSPTIMSPPSPMYYLQPRGPPDFYFEPVSSDSMILGANVTLTCKESHSSQPVSTTGYSWSFLPLNQQQQQLLKEKSSTLALSPLTRNHSGQYQCQTRNDQGFPEQNFAEQGTFILDVFYLENITMTHDLEVNEGEPLTLTCAVNSHPTAHLTWTVNGKAMRHVTDNLDHFFIPNTNCSDSTRYSCHASNSNVPGQGLTATTHVTVLCSQDRTLNNGYSLTLIVILTVLSVVIVVSVIAYVRCRRHNANANTSRKRHETFELMPQVPTDDE